jgi:hypothetical protein
MALVEINVPPEPQDSPPESDSQEAPAPQDPITSMPIPSTETFVLPKRRSLRKLWRFLLVLTVLVGVGLFLHLKYGLLNSDTRFYKVTLPLSQQKSGLKSNSSNTKGLVLDTSKNYGNKYADGILPVGDYKYSSSGAKKGFVYACSGYANNLKSDQGGASSRGPWFIGSTNYNLNKKVKVQGNVNWHSSFTNKVADDVRSIFTNDLPIHKSGTFPISSADPAYAYDRNLNSIQSQSFTYSLDGTPTYGEQTCLGGQVGVMLTGVSLFNGFDAGGRDAGAWEVQDSCSGHPEKTGTYHYHTLSACIKDISIHTVIGFALDGFPITGPQVEKSNILTTTDLDECHGLTSQIVLEGKSVSMYHYVMTQDFPYSVSCFRGKAIQPPGLESQKATSTQPTSYKKIQIPPPIH